MRAMARKKPKKPSNVIAQNKRASFDYELLETFEAGVALSGWEVKSLREGRAQLTESYIVIKNSEAWLFGFHISPLLSASTHVTPDPTRTRKLLLHRRELDKLIGAVERKGYTLIPLALYWKRGRVKLEVALARGKQSHDKRAADKDREWSRNKQRLLRGH